MPAKYRTTGRLISLYVRSNEVKNSFVVCHVNEIFPMSVLTLPFSVLFREKWLLQADVRCDRSSCRWCWSSSSRRWSSSRRRRHPLRTSVPYPNDHFLTSIAKVPTTLASTQDWRSSVKIATISTGNLNCWRSARKYHIFNYLHLT